MREVGEGRRETGGEEREEREKREGRGGRREEGGEEEVATLL